MAAISSDLHDLTNKDKAEEDNSNSIFDTSHECTTSDEEVDIPSRMDIFYDFNGSLGFAIGSSGFILEKYFDDWLPYFRYGSLFWIWGSVLYSIPLLLKLKKGFHEDDKDLNAKRCSSPWSVGDLGEFLCCLFYTIGCIFGGFFNQEQVETFLPAINHTFLYGSLSLAIDPMYKVILILQKQGRSESDIEDAALDKQSRNTDRAERRIQFWDKVCELGAMIFFVLAGAFGGFPPHPSLTLPGVYFWEVGSLFAVGRSIIKVTKRKRGLKLLQNKIALTDRDYSRVNNV